MSFRYGEWKRRGALGRLHTEVMLRNCGAVIALTKDRRDPQAVGLESLAAVSSSLGLPCVLERVRTGSFQKVSG